MLDNVHIKCDKGLDDMKLREWNAAATIAFGEPPLTTNFQQNSDPIH